MSVLRAMEAVPRLASTQMDPSSVAVTLDIHLPLMVEDVMVGVYTSNSCCLQCSMNVLYPFLSVEVNECLDNNGGCDDTCTNTDGSFECSCPPGFRLASDERTCNGNNSTVLTLSQTELHSCIYCAEHVPHASACTNILQLSMNVQKVPTIVLSCVWIQDPRLNAHVEVGSTWLLMVPTALVSMWTF